MVTLCSVFIHVVVSIKPVAQLTGLLHNKAGGYLALCIYKKVRFAACMQVTCYEIVSTKGCVITGNRDYCSHHSLKHEGHLGVRVSATTLTP